MTNIRRRTKRRRHRLVALDHSTFVHHLVTGLVRDLKRSSKMLEIALDERLREVREYELRDPGLRKIIDDTAVPFCDALQQLLERLRARPMKDVTPQHRITSRRQT